jgi:hypothetical protein
MLSELEPVVLTHDVGEVGLTAGDIGAVVHRYDDHRYEVEFVAGSGDTLAVLTLTDRDVRPVAPSEILHARALAS